MGLDINFISRKNVICPHCGTVVATENIYCENSGGRNWFKILEAFGYYVPYDQLTEENNWYGKDMTLTAEQAKQVYDFIKKNPELYNANNIMGLIATALVEGNAVVINADW